MRTHASRIITGTIITAAGTITGITTRTPTRTTLTEGITTATTMATSRPGPAGDATGGVRTEVFDWKWVVLGTAVAFTTYIAVIPLGFLLWQSVRTPQTAAVDAVFTLGNYAAAYGSTATARLFWTSVQFAFGTAVFAFLLGTTLAWMNERTNTPFKQFFFALALIPLVIPSILFTVAWIFLASPQIGILNLVAERWLGLEAPLLDIYSLPGMIWVDGLHYSPMAFLLMTAAFRAMDPSL